MGTLTITPKPVDAVLTNGAAVLADETKMESFVGAMEICSELASALNGAAGKD